MKKKLNVVCFITGLLILFAVPLKAQDREMTRADFLSLMRKSETATKSSPYRNSVTIETGTTPEGPWEPYSSMVDERVLPDRSHLVYTSRIPGEIKRIGKIVYRKSQGGTWVRQQEEAQGWLVNPASTPVFNGPVVEYWIALGDEHSESNGTIMKIVSKPKESSAKVETGTLTYFFYFDDKGLLYKQRSTAFNGTNWVHRVEKYEYDANIQIEAPIK